MMRDDDTICRKVKATITFVVIQETKEDTFGRARSKFMRHGGCRVIMLKALAKAGWFQDIIGSAEGVP